MVCSTFSGSIRFLCMWVLTTVSRLALCACLGVSVSPGFLVLVPRVASRIALAVRADAREVIYISIYLSIYPQPVLNRRRACRALFLGAVMTAPLDALGHPNSHPPMRHPRPPVPRGREEGSRSAKLYLSMGRGPTPLAPVRARFEGTATSGASRSPLAPRRPSRPRAPSDTRPGRCCPARRS